MKKKMWLAAAGIATVLTAPAVAQDGPYLKGGLGYGMMDDVTVERGGAQGTVNPEGDARFMLGAGYALSNGWRFDFDVMDRYADAGAVNDSPISDSDIQNITFMVNAIRDFNRGGRFSPYVGVGVGAHKSQLSHSDNVLGPYISSQDGSAGPAYQGLLGLGLSLSDRLTADLEYRYVDLGGLDGTGYEFEDVTSHDVLFGLRYALTAPAAAVAPAPAPPTAPVAAAPAMTCDNVDFIVYFEWDRSDLTDQAAAVINQAADQAEACSITRVMIEGHADRSGAAAYNVGLSERRARVVRDALVRDGVPASSISIEALGESAPAVETPDGVREPLNRRSEVQIIVAGNSS